MNAVVQPSTPDVVQQQVVEHNKSLRRDTRAHDAFVLVESDEDSESSTYNGEYAELQSDGDEVMDDVDDAPDEPDAREDLEDSEERAHRLKDMRGTTYRQPRHFINHKKLRDAANRARSTPLTTDASLQLAGSLEFLTELLWNRSMMCADAENSSADTVRVKLRHLLKAVDIDPAMEAVFGSKLVEFGAYCSRYVGKSSLRKRHVDEDIAAAKARKQVAAREAARAKAARQRELMEPLDVTDARDDLFGDDDELDHVDRGDRDVPGREHRDDDVEGEGNSVESEEDGRAGRGRHINTQDENGGGSRGSDTVVP